MLTFQTLAQRYGYRCQGQSRKKYRLRRFGPELHCYLYPEDRIAALILFWSVGLQAGHRPSSYTHLLSPYHSCHNPFPKSIGQNSVKHPIFIKLIKQKSFF